MTRWNKSKQTRSCLHEVKERPSNSPLSQHVLVRPGISAHGSELCSSFPLSGSQRQHHTTPTWITVNSEASIQHRGRRDDSQRSRLYQHHRKHAKVRPQRKERTAAGPKLNLWITIRRPVHDWRGKKEGLQYGFMSVASGVALCKKLGSVKSLQQAAHWTGQRTIKMAYGITDLQREEQECSSFSTPVISLYLH